MTVGRAIEPEAVRRPLADGIVLLDKPTGLSSHAALQRVRRLFRSRRAGHTGSLDPLASGMLPVCLDEATKVCGFLLSSDKTYRFRVRFGVRTSTGDLEGDEVGSGPPEVSRGVLEEALAGMLGTVMQVPPMHSAVRHKGERLYRLARAGQVVDRPARPIEIRTFVMDDWNPRSPSFIVRCSKGTYIRVLAEDLAARLGTVGHVVALRRLAVAPFEAGDMVPLETLQQVAEADPAGLAGFLRPMDSALEHLPAARLSEEESWRMRRGQALPWITGPECSALRLYDAAGSFLGVGATLADGRLVPRRLLAEHATGAGSEIGL